MILFVDMCLNASSLRFFRCSYFMNNNFTGSKPGFIHWDYWKFKTSCISGMFLLYSSGE